MVGLVAARLAVWVWAVGVRVSWDEYFFLFGTVYLHWGVVLNPPGVKCVLKGLFRCESCAMRPMRVCTVQATALYCSV